MSDPTAPVKTTRLRFSRHAVAAGVAYGPGDEAELPDALAAHYVAEGSAGPVADPAPAPPEGGEKRRPR